jgi:hypothetical protein
VDFTSHSRPCEFQCDQPVFVSDPARAYAMFRIAQEALRLASRGRSKKRLELRLAQKKSELVLTISPFPARFAPPKSPLKLIDLYCQSIGASLSFEPKGRILVCAVSNQ